MQNRFSIGGPEAEAVALTWLADDMSRARLSATFRAYYLLRRLIPLRMRQVLQRFRSVEANQRWYFPDAFVDAFGEAIRREFPGHAVIHPWPHGRPYAFVLTHDVETAEGMKNIPRLARMEEELGFRSSWNLVPYKYKIDEGLVGDLQARGFEIGIHGFNHDGRLYFSEKEFGRRAIGINAALARYGAVGFRSPMVHRNLQWLQSLNISYDASCFDVDPYQAMPGGVGSIWPFVAGKFVELPYTLPQDHTLFIARGEEDGRTWEAKRDFLVRYHGLALMLTHPDYLTSAHYFDTYRRFLVSTKEVGGCWHALPREVADWWRRREESTVVQRREETWTVIGPASDAGVAVSVEALADRLIFHCLKRPMKRRVTHPH